MLRHLVLTSVALLGFLLAHTGLASGQLPARQASRAAGPVTQAPADVLSAFVAGFNAQQASRAAAVFSADAELMLPEAPPAKGREAVLATLDELFLTPRTVDLHSTTVTQSGRLAVASGRLTMSTRTPAHGAEIRAGSYLAVLRQGNRGWEITQLMFTLPLRPDFVG